MIVRETVSNYEEDVYERPTMWEKSLFSENQHQIKRFDETEKLIPKDVTSLLDVGCGNGAFLERFKKYNPDVKVMGLERSKVATDMNYFSSKPCVGNIDSIPFSDNSFDIVSALEVIEHLPYRTYEIGLKELERVAKEYIIISVPYKELRSKALCPYCQCYFNPDYHLRSFDENTIEKIFKNFIQVKQFKVYIEDFWFLNSFRRFNWNNSNKWRSDFVCPQCGYQESGGEVSKKSTHSENPFCKIKSILKKIAPKKNIPFWLVALYKKHGK